MKNRPEKMRDASASLGWGEVWGGMGLGGWRSVCSSVLDGAGRHERGVSGLGSCGKL